MTLGDLLDLLNRLGSTVSPEAEGFTELDHGLQCAFELSRSRPGDLELQIAGLVHDIGHQFGDDENHGRLGAEQVRPVLGDRVAELVQAHITAKRYLLSTDPSYLSALSTVSTATYHLQGGALSRAEIILFRGSVQFASALELRHADDAAKVPGRNVPPLDHWVPRLVEIGQ